MRQQAIYACISKDSNNSYVLELRTNHDFLLSPKFKKKDEDWVLLLPSPIIKVAETKKDDLNKLFELSHNLFNTPEKIWEYEGDYFWWTELKGMKS